MPELATPLQPHHSWWVSIALAALRTLRPLFHLNADEDAAWALVVNILESL